MSSLLPWDIQDRLSSPAKEQWPAQPPRTRADHLPPAVDPVRAITAPFTENTPNE